LAYQTDAKEEVVLWVAMLFGALLMLFVGGLAVFVSPLFFGAEWAVIILMGFLTLKAS
jgi:hypothetical protein